MNQQNSSNAIDSRSSAASYSGSAGWHRGLWALQVLLAAAFFAGGAMKVSTPLDELAKAMPWVSSVPTWVPGLAGGSEVLAAFGLILPSATRIQPRLTVAAASGLVVVMLLASALHASRSEFEALPVNAVLGGLAALVAWGRSTKAVIASRG